MLAYGVSNLCKHKQAQKLKWFFLERLKLFQVKKTFDYINLPTVLKAHAGGF